VSKLPVVFLGVFALIAVAPPAHAICSGSRPANEFTGYIAGCPDAFPVAGFLAVVGSADTINNNGIDFMCEDGAALDPAKVPCLPDAGVIGDGRVDIQFDWANLDFSTAPPTQPLGCPDPAGVPGVDRNFAQIVCNDGTGVIVTVDYDIGTAGYPFYFMARLDLGNSELVLPLSKGQTGLSVMSSNRAGGLDTLCIAQTGPVPIYSDCDPESLAFQYGVGCDTPTPTVSPGANFYLTIGPATPPPTDLRVAAWSLQSTTPGPGGSRCIRYTTPPAGDCARVGSTAVVAGQDTGAIASWISSCDVPMATDSVGIDSAVLSHGRLQVDFSTGNETLITGFNVYAETTKLNAAPIPAQGTGSNSYTFDVGRGALKSVRTVLVEAVKSDGTVVRTDPVSLK
jgi:hypothetical protein